MRRKLEGDTLIEVLFAFAILSAVIGTAFSGAIGSYKSAVAAQQRTQAQLLAQYQADGLLTYRRSLEWNSTELPSFLGPGNKFQYEKFCMEAIQNNTNSSRPYTWRIEVNVDKCSELGKNQAINLNNPKISITPDEKNNDNKKGFTVTVSWQPANAKSTDQSETATRSVILTDK